MAKIDKLIARFKTIPSDFDYRELVNLLKHFDYIEDNKGKTGGSRVCFFRASDNAKILGDKPHGGDKSVSQGWLKRIKLYLENKGDI